MRQPSPTTVSYGTGLTERRDRHSGQIDAKPCGRCHGSVVLDPRQMRVSDGRAVVACLGCGTLVSVRRSDLYRDTPEGRGTERRERKRRGWWGRKAHAEQAPPAAETAPPAPVAASPRATRRDDDIATTRAGHLEGGGGP
ncbi:MAG TPA: hypothetical protein VMU14_20145, partial [Acidimicrobiales bacterium]|nr:hypothetical protein [Acidimicrobiales bacterium]